MYVIQMLSVNDVWHNELLNSYEDAISHVVSLPQMKEIILFELDL